MMTTNRSAINDALRFLLLKNSWGKGKDHRSWNKTMETDRSKNSERTTRINKYRVD